MESGIAIKLDHLHEEYNAIVPMMLEWIEERCGPIQKVSYDGIVHTQDYKLYFYYPYEIDPNRVTGKRKNLCHNWWVKIVTFNPDYIEESHDLNDPELFQNLEGFIDKNEKHRQCLQQ